MKQTDHNRKCECEHDSHFDADGPSHRHPYMATRANVQQCHTMFGTHWVCNECVILNHMYTRYIPTGEAK